MNRRERCATSKRLGNLQYQKKLPLNKKFNLIRENIIAGKQSQKEFSEENRVNQSKNNDEIVSKKVYETASEIVEKQKMPFIAALEKANIDNILSPNKE